MSRRTSASSQAIISFCFCLAEWRCMYFNSSSTCRWPTKWRAAIWEVEPYPKCQVTVNLMCSGDLESLSSLSKTKACVGRGLERNSRLCGGLGLGSSGNQTYRAVWRYRSAACPDTGLKMWSLLSCSWDFILLKQIVSDVLAFPSPCYPTLTFFRLVQDTTSGKEHFWVYRPIHVGIILPTVCLPVFVSASCPAAWYLEQLAT